MKRHIFLAAIGIAFQTLALSQPATIAPPLHTDGARIVDSQGRPVRLASVNWYGFDEKEYVAGGLDHAPLATIVEQIQKIGLNSVRLPWANETYERNPVVRDYAVAANPQLKGKHAMEIMDAVIEALAKARILVVLDNHVSRADWCCSETDGNGLWYNDEYPETKWLADWKGIARRYRNQPWVVGADLRNELRSGAVWGGAEPRFDWHAAVGRGGKAVLEGNSNLLIMVEGPDWARDFRGVVKLPVQLPVEHRLVYSPHAYNDSYGEHNERYEARVGFLTHTQPAVPIWIGEMGTCQTLDCGSNSEWFKSFSQILRENDSISWSYWPLNGTQSSGGGRTYDAVESYGLLTPDYKNIAAPRLVELLRTIAVQPRTLALADAGQKSDLRGLPKFPGGWTVVNGEKGQISSHDGVLRIAPALNTNLFHAPGANFDVVNAPMVLFAPEGDFTLKAKVSAQLVNAYDIGALVIYEDDRHWAKLCFENSAQREATIVSVVTRERSDDTNSETVASPFVYLAIARKGVEWSMHFSRDGKQWRLVRHFPLQLGAGFRVGFASHTDSNQQFFASFSEIVYRASAPRDMRQLEAGDIVGE